MTVDETTPVATFTQVYVGVNGDRGMHLHAEGLCDHTGDLTPAYQHELSELERCGQCLNRAAELGVLVQPQAELVACPTCFLVGPCECEN